MAIKKIKDTPLTKKRAVADDVEKAPDLEEKRKAFQDAVVTKKPFIKEPEVAKPHSNRKRTFIIAVAAALVLLGSAAAVYAYFWYQSPSKIVMDAVLNAVSSPSASFSGSGASVSSSEPGVTFTAGSKDGKIELEAYVKTGYQGDLSTMKIGVMTDQQKTFVKIDKASGFLSAVTPKSQKAAYDAAVSVVKKQVDGKWVQITPEEAGMVSSFTNVSGCTVQVLRQMTTDKAMSRVMMAAYKKHQFMNINEEASPTEMTGVYTLTANPDVFGDFVSEVAAADGVPVSFGDCAKQLRRANTTAIKNMTVTLTINKSDRTITDMRVATGATPESFVIKVSPVFGSQRDIPLPKDAVKFNDISTDIFKQYMSSTLQLMNRSFSSVIMGS